MSPSPRPCPATALIAEDEPLLAAVLQAALARLWPELRVLAVVGDGLSAVSQTLLHQPDVLFFDIQMPGQTGLQAAAELADAWPEHTDAPFPALVFLTAYEQYAVHAFEAQALDYLLKPLQTERLQKTVSKVALALAARGPAAMHLEATLAQLRGLLTPPAPAVAAPLAMLQVSVGTSVRLLPVAQVLYFEAADKYVRVLTAGQEFLIRTPLKDLLAQLDAASFWQIHRGTVVNIAHVDTVTRHDNGQLSLSLRERADTLAVSRLYAHRFKAM